MILTINANKGKVKDYPSILIKKEEIVPFSFISPITGFDRFAGTN